MKILIHCAQQLYADALFLVLTAAFESDSFEIFSRTDRPRQISDSSMDILIIDVASKPFQDLETIYGYRMLFPDLRVICILPELWDHIKTRPLLRTGLVSLVSKHAPLSQLEESIKKAKERRQFIAPSFQDEIVKTLLGERAPVPHFSRREKLVMEKICGGMTIKEIAYELGISRHTVQYYHRRVLDKFHVKRSVDMIILAIQTGLYTPPVFKAGGDHKQ